MRFDKLDRFLSHLVADYGIPGVECAVSLHGRLVYRGSAGYSDREAGRAVCPDDLYRLYSVSKVFTCTAAMQQLERGAFLLSDPLYDYLPEYRDVAVSDGGKLRKPHRPIEIRDLFTMCAGLNYDINAPAIAKAVADSGGLAPTRAIARAIAQGPLSFDPGAHWQYSLCHDVLAALVEVVSGLRFSEYMRRYVFEPAGLSDACYHLPAEKEPRLAALYEYDGHAAHRKDCGNTFVPGPDYDSGGAGMIASTSDCIAFAAALANGGLAQTGERLLSAYSIDKLRQNCLGSAQLSDYNWPQLRGYGYGLGVRTHLDASLSDSISPLGEFGWGGAAGAFLSASPESGVAIFYMQHMLNNIEPYVHPRLRNIVYSCIG